MDSDELRAEFEAARTRSRVMLDPEACSSAVAEEQAAQFVHRTDGFLCDWAAGMPRKAEPKPATEKAGTARLLTDAEALRWEQYIDGKISAAIKQHDEIWHDVIGAVIAEERKKMRAEILEQCGLLRADIEIQKAAERRERGDGIVELPALPLRARHG